MTKKSRMVACSHALLIATAFTATGLRAQEVRYTVAPETSLGWWQVDPNFGHLWATTCPEDPSWQAGDARGMGTNVVSETRQKTVPSSHHDSRIPIYPRQAVNPVCRRAVTGWVSVGDTATWKNVKAQIMVLGDSLYTGLDMRDSFARHAVLETAHNRYIKFSVDSLINVVQANDTITAIAHGTFELHGVQQPMAAPVKAWHDGGGLRVQAHFFFPAEDLTHVYAMSKMALGMGVVMGRWKVVHMGVDVVLARGGTAEPAQPKSN
jgi:hypothetical protein